MSLDLITGHQGVAHISAAQISDINKAMMNGYGDNKVMRMTGGAITQNALSIEIATGYWRANGFDIQIQEAETHYIDPSTIGTSRIDNIYVELLQDIPTGAQRAEITIIMGEEAASPVAPDDPTEPYLNTDYLLDAVKIATVTVTEGAMVFTDLTEAYDLVTPSELAEVQQMVVGTQQMIAPIESSTTASQAYAIGDQFILNGLLTEATAAISQGNTITVGDAGNAKLADCVLDQVSTIKAASTPSHQEFHIHEYLGGTIVRLGKLRIIYVYDGAGKVPAATYNNVLPQRDVPAYDFTASAWVLVGDNNQHGSRTLSFTKNSRSITLNNSFERGGFTFAYYVE